MTHGMTDALREEVLTILLQQHVLQFGDFKGKSGRPLPYFFNFGRLHEGNGLRQLAHAYGVAATACFPKVRTFFGPAYKGIPLVVATALELSRDGRPACFSFNRKEPKAHGEGGEIVGYALTSTDRVVIVEDVITAGTSLRESLVLLRGLGVKVDGVIVGVDRCERGRTERRASSELEDEFGVRVVALLTIHQILERLYESEVMGHRWIDAAGRRRIEQHLEQVGGTD